MCRLPVLGLTVLEDHISFANSVRGKFGRRTESQMWWYWGHGANNVTGL